jgi:ribosomal protein S18 acetylase RimI-like enzyme
MVRDYRDEDFASICAINNASFPNPSPDWYLEEQGLRIGKGWVYEVDGKVVGYIIGKVKYKIPYVFSVAVLKDYRKRGIAKALFEAFELFYSATQKPENMSFWLQVSQHNPAQKLYFDLGYKVGFVDENYYGHGDHALCMYKTARPMSDIKY